METKKRKKTYYAGITKAKVVKYWKGKPQYDVPEISNCVMCFHHTIRQLQKQWQDHRNLAKMQWAADAEAKKAAPSFNILQWTRSAGYPSRPNSNFPTSPAATVVPVPIDPSAMHIRRGGS